MSDSTGNSPPREGGPSQNDKTADFSESPPPETSDGGSSPRLNPLEITIWVSRWRERLLACLDETLSRKAGDADPIYLKTVLPVMDRLASIGSGLIAMVMVDRHYGPAGLGIFAWFFSLLAIAGYLARYGIPVYLENRMARSPESVDESAACAMAALVATGFAAIILCGAAAFSIAGPDWGTGDRILYLTYVLLTVIDIGMIVSLMAAPILFGALLWLVGFFNSSYPPSSNEPMQHTPA
jgi:hypothetical protein